MAHPAELLRGERDLGPGAAAAFTAETAFLRIEKEGRLFRPLSAVHAMVEAGLEPLAGGKMEQEAGKQRLPGLIRKSQAGEGMQQEHEEFLLLLLRLGGGFGGLGQRDANGPGQLRRRVRRPRLRHSG